jgi:hypothetical protein
MDPNYFNFDDEVLYSFNIDNNQDGKAEDIVYEFRFKTETRPILGSLALSAALRRQSSYSGCRSSGNHEPRRRGDLKGLSRRQTYTVTEVRGKKTNGAIQRAEAHCGAVQCRAGYHAEL